VTYCARLGQLYWNHEDCSFEFCPFVAEEYGQCHSCWHRQEGRCALTQAPLPAEGGCCHWNVKPVQVRQIVTLEMLTPLGVEPTETVTDVLNSLGAPYEVDSQGYLWLEPNRLSLPYTYGLGTETMPEELLDWTDWENLWGGDAACDTVCPVSA
jgi:hypothetical protein